MRGAAVRPAGDGNVNFHDCAPTLTDGEVLEFCKRGYLLLEAVVPDEVNRRAIEYLAGNTHYEPTEILSEPWFRDGVVLNPQASGAIGSLLGRNFHLPVLMSNHRVECPAPAGGWHVDGNSDFSSPRVDYLQVFYYAQAAPLEMGPTEVVPSSHLVPNVGQAMAHYDAIRGAVATAAPAGSIFITMYRIWHRRRPSRGSGVRNLLKYFYWRTEAPARYWIVDPAFDFATAGYVSSAAHMVGQFRDAIQVSRMFLWLCGKGELAQNLGGQSWPLPAHRNDLPYGFPAGLAG